MESATQSVSTIGAPAPEFFPEQLIRFPQVAKMTTLSRGWIWLLEKDGKFPKRVQLGENAVAWKLREVQEWCANRPRVTVGARSKQAA